MEHTVVIQRLTSPEFQLDQQQVNKELHQPVLVSQPRLVPLSLQSQNFSNNWSTLELLLLKLPQLTRVFLLPKLLQLTKVFKLLEQHLPIKEFSLPKLPQLTRVFLLPKPLQLTKVFKLLDQHLPTKESLLPKLLELMPEFSLPKPLQPTKESLLLNQPAPPKDFNMLLQLLLQKSQLYHLSFFCESN